MSVVTGAIPADLRRRRQWLVWRPEQRNGKSTKVPYSVAGTLASVTAPATWTTFADACAAMQRISGDGGIGFVFTDSDEFAFIDLDHCIDPASGEVAPWAQEIVSLLDSYTERSPSGDGLHVIVRGRPPGPRHRCAVDAEPTSPLGRPGLELYFADRYSTFTGDHLSGTRTTIEDRRQPLAMLYAAHFPAESSRPRQPITPVAVDDAELIQKALTAANGDKFTRLWNGDVGGYPSGSEADAAFCAIAAFWTGADGERIDRWLRQSTLFREKWDERHSSEGLTYGQLTIQFALDNCTEVYTPSNGTARTRSAAGPVEVLSTLADDDDEPNFANFANDSEEKMWDDPTPLGEIELAPLPTDVFPNAVRAMIEAEAIATQTPPDLAVMQTLAALATAAQKKCIVRITPGYSEPLNLYLTTIMDSGTRKTAVVTDMAAPIAEHQRDLIDAAQSEIAEREAEYNIAEERLKHAMNQAAKAEGAEIEQTLAAARECAREVAAMERPHAPRLLTEDTTPEKLGMMLAQQDGKMAILSAEGTLFGIIAGRYSQDGQPNQELWLKAHSGEDWISDRVSRASIHVRDTALTIGVAVQPDVIRGIADTQSLRERGLVPRFLFARPASLLGRRQADPPPVPPRIRDAFHRLIRALLDMPMGTDENGDATAHVLALSPEAAALRIAFIEEMEPMLGEMGSLATLADWASKAQGAVSRIAGLLHLADHALDASPWSAPISGAVMARAIRFINACIPHARAVFDDMGLDEDLRDARYVLRVLQRWQVDGEQVTAFSRRDLFEKTKGTLKRTKRLEQALAVLEDHGWVHGIDLGGARGPGRPSPRFLAHPQIHSQNSQKPPANPLDGLSANIANDFQGSETARGDVEPVTEVNKPDVYDSDETCPGCNGNDYWKDGDAWGCVQCKPFQDAAGPAEVTHD